MKSIQYYALSLSIQMSKKELSLFLLLHEQFA
jgi:hypothetical protein